ncbi:MAG: hypothetical protein PHI72_09315 [Atribacterota bacterium]|nr:hypothetical protein [Atribacterota bacterium]MDD4896909.1 hypothetical protein [Atribacterota bacterium]MDD5637728.1 hypothetical protein [Atribacterota bacterium]
MNQFSIILITILLLIVVIYLFIRKGGKEGRKKKALRERYYKLLRLPPELAAETMERQMRNLKEKHPHKSEEWYLEKIIYDLERDRR